MSAAAMKSSIVALVRNWGDMCAGGSGEERVPSGPCAGQRYGEAYYNLAEAIEKLPEPLPGPVRDGASLAEKLDAQARAAIKGAWTPEDPDAGATNWRVYRDGGEAVICLHSAMGMGSSFATFQNNGWPGSGDKTAELVVTLANNLPKILQALRFQARAPEQTA